MNQQELMFKLLVDARNHYIKSMEYADTMLLNAPPPPAHKRQYRGELTVEQKNAIDAWTIAERAGEAYIRARTNYVRYLYDDEPPRPPMPQPEPTKYDDDIVDVLCNMGFAKREAIAAVKALPDKIVPLEKRLEEALKSLST